MLATAVRVFAPDLRSAVRFLLRTGVRVGAAALVEDSTRRGPVHEPLVPASRTEEA